MQAQRYWIERSFQDSKSELGMSDYQVRKWSGWHHHMALVILALSFIVKERIKTNGLPLTQLSRHPNYDHCIADWRQRIGQKKEVANGNKA